MFEDIEESVVTFDDINSVIQGLRKRVLFLAKTEYTGSDKEDLIRVAYELEKAGNVL